ncbi:MAG: hypothetical protein ACRECH_07340, partial [Nitrososphaerales archaeon]
ARREFDKAARGETSQAPSNGQGASSSTINQQQQPLDPLVEAAEKEGINTQGKTKDQIASELSWKLNKK